MITWTLLQYRNVVDSFLIQCDTEMQEMFIRRLGILLEKGIECKMPISEPLGDGLFALRARSKNVRARLIYYFGEKRQIIFVHAIYKDTPRIGQHNIAIAKRNRDIVKGKKGKLDDFHFVS